MKTSFSILLAAGLLFACNNSGNESGTGPNAGLVGTWTWVKYSRHNQDTSYVWNDIKGQIIFTPKYYSLIYVYKSGPRDRIRNGGFDSLSIQELKTSLGPVVSNSGSYTVVGDSIVFQRDVALWPNAMLNKRLAIAMPVKISKDTLVWNFDDQENIWVRRQ